MHHRSSALPPPSANPGLPLALPASTGPFVRDPATRRVDASGIFEYMDGAGELYLAYRFDHIEVLQYRAAGVDEILVELYFMHGSDDAFGLLSGDWGGEPWNLGGTRLAAEPGSFPRALYGAGLLRVWSDTVYARVMATNETAASRQAVLELGKAIVACRPEPAPPALVTSLPTTVGRFLERTDSLCFLRSHLVLNSVYFLGQKNILDLGPEVDAVTCRYDRAGADGKPERVRLVLIRYPDAHRARQALAGFRQAYLPETQRGQGIGELTLVKIEDGWAACQLHGSSLALALEAPDSDAATTFIATALKALDTTEKPHV